MCRELLALSLSGAVSLYVRALPALCTVVTGTADFGLPDVSYEDAKGVHMIISGLGFRLLLFRV